MYKIAIVDKMHEDGINLLKKNPNFQCEIIEDLSKGNLISKLPDFDGITLRRGKIDAEILEKCKKLKVISRHGVGYDNIDIEEATKYPPGERILFEKELIKRDSLRKWLYGLGGHLFWTSIFWDIYNKVNSLIN